MIIDPLEALSPILRRAAEAALGADAVGVDPSLRASEHADAQANFAMALGKKLKKPPREIAEIVAKQIDAPDVIASVAVAGPGFLNITLAPAFLARATTHALSDARLGVPEAEIKERVVIDYSAPNVAKEMHVGHLRSTIIGDALSRVLAWRGHTVIRQNHVGDWGTPFGMLLEHLVDLGGEATSASVGELGAFYRAARKKFEEDPAFAERSRKRVVLLQSGDGPTLELWRALVAVSRLHFEDVYAKLDVGLTAADECGESFYNPLLAPLASDLEASGRATVSEGALCVFPPGFKTKEGAPLPLIVKKSDGGFGYATTDLAAIRHRLSTLKATRLLYVVGSPQATHLSMVFTAAKELGWLAPPARAEHVPFGSVLGPDRKMLKSREGDAVRLVDLLDEAVARAKEVIAEKRGGEVETLDDLARTIGIGAVKYADLSNDRVKDYVFDLDRMVAFDGNTAGYLQYAHARIRSIVRKAEVEGASASAITVLEEPNERRLARLLLGFGAAVGGVESSLEPHRLAGFLFEVATSFTSFYETCPVLKSEGAVRTSRLALSDLTARTLAQGLALLGIRAPEKM